jgi:hypothetical protein
MNSEEASGQPPWDRPFTVPEALGIIRRGTESEFELIYAAGVLMDHCEQDDSITIVDLLRLLDFPDSVAGEMGVRALYLRTGRDNLDWSAGVPDGVPFVTDKDDWIAYLTHHGLVTREGTQSAT